MWDLVRIGDVTEVSTGGTPSTSHPEYYGGEIRWTRSGDVRGPFIDDVPSRITEAGVANSNARIHPEGTVLLAMSGQGATRGRAAILRVPSACSQSVAAILPSSRTVPEFVYFAITLQYDFIRKVTGDNERSGLNLKLVRELRIPLPPVSEQKRIAAILIEQMAAVEKARAALETQRGQIDALSDAVLRRAFSGQL